jgi:hypothetical protein
MSEITVRYAFCPKHYDRHMIDEKEKCHGTDPQDLEKRGYRYLRHIGGGWFRYREPQPPRSRLPYALQPKPEPEPPEHDIHVLEPDF